MCRAVETKDGPMLLAIACDGAGSAKKSEEGAGLAVEMFFYEFGSACDEESLASVDREFAVAWLDALRNAIADRAAAAGLMPRDYACTVLAAVIGPDRASFFQIGDGAIVVSSAGEPGEYGWMFWPQHGEFANTTNFVTQDNAADVLQFETYEGQIDEVALFTDGIERLVLDIAAKTVHAPFFRPLFDWLATTEPPAGEAQSAPLARYLGSKQVNDRTDDDKTLILATRRTASTEGDDAASKSRETAV